MMVFAVTAAIFAGGAGSVIIGGLYWKRGTTPAAYTALLLGAVISISGIIVHQFSEGFFITGQDFYMLSIVGSVGGYVLVSLFGPRSVTNMDKLLNRGVFQKGGEYKEISNEPVKGWKILGMGKEFTKGDKFIYIATYAWTAMWVLVFIVGTIYYFTNGISDESWLGFWKIYIVIGLVMSIIVTLWFAVGGFFDIKYMLNKLKTMGRDHTDDGSVSEDYGK